MDLTKNFAEKLHLVASKLRHILPDIGEFNVETRWSSDHSKFKGIAHQIRIQ